MDAFMNFLPSKCTVFQREINADPWNYKAWYSLLSEIASLSESTIQNIDRPSVESLFKQALENYPADGKFWFIYAEYVYKSRKFSMLEEIFAKSLPCVINCTDLWKLYLKYVAETNVPSTNEDIQVQKDKRSIVIKAYEAAIASIGCSPFSGSLWQDFIDYIKSLQAESFYEEQQNVDLLRRIYSRAIQIPTASIESIWKEFDAFENQLNKLTAKKILGEKSFVYMTSRSAYKEMSMFLNDIRFDTVLPPPTSKTYDLQELQRQFDAWNQLIQWELKNPLRIEDTERLHSRLMFWYRMSVDYLRFCPQTWFNAAIYLVSLGRVEEAASFFSNAIKALPDSLLVHFSYADFQESNQNFEIAKDIYESLLKKYEDQINQYLKSNALTDSFKSDVQEEDSNNEKFQQLLAMHPALMQKTEFISLTFIQYMHFLRRSEGIKSSRQVFSRARKSFFCSPQIFIAAALLEYYCTKDSSISVKIFELGMKRYVNSVVYVEEYLKFSILLNDDINARSLFERAIAVHPEERRIWELFLDYVCKYGDLNEIQLLQKRFMELFPQKAKESATYFATKYKYLDLSLNQELVSLDVQKPPTAPAPFVAVSGTDPVERLLKILPLPAQFDGPTISSSELIEVILQSNIPKSTVFKKRRDFDSEDEDDLRNARRREQPHETGQGKDLFRSRQQQKRGRY